MEIAAGSYDLVITDVSMPVASGLDVAEAARAGFRAILCNRPDGEGADQPTFEEIEAVASVLVNRFGVDSIRLTGGEPTIRPDVVEIAVTTPRSPSISTSLPGEKRRLT